MNLKERIKNEWVAALKAKNSQRSQIINSIMAAIKQVEVDTRIEQDDNGVLTILNKMVKQHNESIMQFSAAGRVDLTAIEENELKIIKEFLPEQASQEEIDIVVAQALHNVGSNSIKDMGRIMGLVKSQLLGKCDMTKVSQLVKSKLQ